MTLIAIFSGAKVLAELRQQIQRILNFVHSLTRIISGGISIILGFCEHFRILFPNSKYRATVGLGHILLVIRPSERMIPWPLVKVECVEEDLTIQQFSDRDVLLEKKVEILQENETGDEIVLVLDHVVDHDVDRLDLIIFQGAIDRRNIVIHICCIFSLFLRLLFLGHFIFVDDRVFLVKVLFVFAPQKTCYRTAVKRKQGHHVGAVQLQE